MKLVFEKNSDIVRLSTYFKKIEALADKMGIDVDDLVKEPSTKKASMYTSFKKNLLSLAQRRSDLLSKRKNGGINPESNSSAGMTIITNSKN